MSEPASFVATPPSPGCEIIDAIILLSPTPLPLTMLLKSTTRHIHIYAAEVANNQLIPSESVLTLDIDPDNELVWNEGALQQVRQKFDELVTTYKGEDLIEYNMRRIGSDLEHLVRSLLQQGIVAYNLKSRVKNYSMGLPQVADAG
jgi:NAD(P)H-quinone oxidoreductase subunit M